MNREPLTCLNDRTFVQALRMNSSFRLFLISTFCAALAALLTSPSFASPGTDSWPRWRGPLDNGNASAGSYPVKWTAESALWKVALPGKGFSTPVVTQGRVFLTAPVNDLDA